MRPGDLRRLLEHLKQGAISLEEAIERLERLPFESLGEVTIDHHREIRCGFPEVILGRGKSVEQIAQIAERILASGQTLLITRVESEVKPALEARLGPLDYNPLARTMSRAGEGMQRAGRVAVVCAGTADLPVAEEAAVTAALLAAEVVRIYDVGVAGLHRLLAHTEILRRQDAVVVAAGMEGALPSVVGGLVAVPVVAVPTSVGYGAALSGLTALLAMLTSCAANVVVVNVDNGFGAGYTAGLIARKAGSFTNAKDRR
jgi:hypothetical protein